MPYARFDDRYDDHRKIKRAWRRQPAAVALHAMAITYANRHVTDGLVDVEWVQEKLELLPFRSTKRAEVLTVLVESGLFEKHGPDHYLIHDFLEWNLSKAQRLQLSKQGREGGRAKARLADPDGPGSSQGQSEGQSEGSSTPTPTPTPTPRTTTPSLRSDVLECFAYWQEKCNHPTAKLTPERARKIEARRREDYTVHNIRRAIDGAARAPFVDDSGKRFDDIELICRNGSKLESFMLRAEVNLSAAPVVPITRAPHLERMDAWKRGYPAEGSA